MHKIIFEENHVHSTYSDGKLPVSDLLEYNNTHDKLDLIFADHVDKKTDWFPAYVSELRRLRRRYKDFKVRIGCEVKIDDATGKLNTTARILKQAEVVLGSVHFFKDIRTFNREKLLKREYGLTKQLVKNLDIDILAHPFSMSQRFFNIDPPTRYIDAIFRLCVARGIKFEFSSKHSLLNSRNYIAKKMLDRSSSRHISFGSDVHYKLEEIGDSAFQLASPVTVLVTGAGAGVAQSIIKAIRLSKVPTRIVATDHDPMTAGLYRADVAYTVPLAKEPGYISRLIRICQLEKVRLLLVGTDVELEAIAANRRKIEAATGARVIVSPPSAIAIADDKWKTVQFLKRYGFSAPDSCLPKDVDAFVKKHGFPLIVKPRIGARSIGFSVVRDQAALRSRLAALEAPIIQEYLSNENEEYTCGVFFIRGKSYGAISMKRWLRNGDTYKAVIDHNPAIEAFVTLVGRRLGIHGPCNFQLRRDGNKFKIFEINCRFSGTTGTQSYVGFNVVNALLQFLFFKRPIKPLSFKPAVMMRYWNELFTDAAQTKTLHSRGVLPSPHSELNVF